VRGTQLYAEMLYHTLRARDLARARGWRLEVAAVCLLAGEQEAATKADAAAFQNTLVRFQQDLEADIMPITGQTEPVRLMLSQTNRATVALRAPEIHTAMLRAQDRNPRVRCVGPVYHVAPEVRPNAPASYPTGAGYRRIGQQFGHFVMDDIWGTQRSPLQVLDNWWESDRAFVLRYPVPLALEADDTRITLSTLGAGLGIDFIDGARTERAIESVTVHPSDPCALIVKLAEAPLQPRQRVFIAARRSEGGGIGRIAGPRSGIRARDPYHSDPQTGDDLYDWACTETVVLR